MVSLSKALRNPCIFADKFKFLSRWVFFFFPFTQGSNQLYSQFWGQLLDVKARRYCLMRCFVLGTQVLGIVACTANFCKCASQLFFKCRISIKPGWKGDSGCARWWNTPLSLNKQHVEVENLPAKLQAIYSSSLFAFVRCNDFGFSNCGIFKCNKILARAAEWQITFVCLRPATLVYSGLEASLCKQYASLTVFRARNKEKKPKNQQTLSVYSLRSTAGHNTKLFLFREIIWKSDSAFELKFAFI